MTLRSSSVSLPHFSLAAPLNCFQLPSTLFQSIVISPLVLRWTFNGRDKQSFREQRAASWTVLRRIKSARGLRFLATRGENVLGVAVRLFASLEDEIAGRLESDTVEGRRHRFVEGIAGILL